MANVYLRLVPAARVTTVELDTMEAEVLVVPPDETVLSLDEMTPDEKEKEAKRLRLLKWLAPKKGVARDRLDAAEVAAQSEAARRAERTTTAEVMSLGNDFHARPLIEYLRIVGLADAIGGGREVGADVGNGRPAILRPDAAAKLADALMDVERPSDPRIESQLLSVIAFYQDAKRRGDGVLHYRI